MRHMPGTFDPRQKMQGTEYEVQYKRDINLTQVDLHHHDFFEIYYLVSGDVSYTIESHLFQVMPGDLLLISPRELHQITICPNPDVYERFVLWLDADMIRRLSTPKTDLMACLDPSRPGYHNLFRLESAQRRRVFGLFGELYEVQQRGGFGADVMPDVLVTELLVAINRLQESLADGASGADPSAEQIETSSPLVTDIVRYISENYGQPLSLDLLADRFYVSKYHLSHQFQRQVGTGVHRYILKKRLLIAREQLGDGAKPGEVWADCGFGDYTSFYRAFRAEYHISPKEFALSRQS